MTSSTTGFSVAGARSTYHSHVLRAALPEGVLDDGGVVTGYLFFESPLDKESRVTFEATFGGGDGQTTVASIEIPFKVE